ncbi:MAG: fibronectin type III domain-containing protein, partial [Bacteroidales bacterium]|nr:fibronectin type III domain-containing protein [Bacteroidales bacterium]
MKRILKYIAVLATLCAGVAATSCINDKELVESIELTRCLTPLDLSVKIIDGDQVMFRWEAVKGADMYALEVYSDKAMTEVVVSEEISSKDLPVTIKLEADSEYWFRVKAFDSTSKLEPSKWAVYQKSVKTYAVKPTVYPAVADRSATSITVSWDAEAAASEVDSVKWCVLGSEEQL